MPAPSYIPRPCEKCAHSPLRVEMEVTSRKVPRPEGDGLGEPVTETRAEPILVCESCGHTTRTLGPDGPTQRDGFVLSMGFGEVLTSLAAERYQATQAGRPFPRSWNHLDADTRVQLEADEYDLLLPVFTATLAIGVDLVGTLMASNLSAYDASPRTLAQLHLTAAQALSQMTIGFDGLGPAVHAEARAAKLRQEARS